MTCDEARERFSALVDGVLDAGGRDAVAAHLATCPECARELERFRRTVELLRAVEPARAPDGFAERVVAAARAAPARAPARRRRGAPRRLALPLPAAAAVLVTLGALYVWQTQLGDLQQVARPRESVPLSRDAPEGPPAGSPPAALGERAVGELRKEAPAPGGAGGREGVASKAPARERADVAAPPKPSPAAPAAAGTAGVDVAEGQKAAAAPAESRVERRAAVVPPADVVGRLAAADRGAAARALDELIARAGGVVLAWQIEPGLATVEVTVPRAAYPELAATLGRLGRWVVEREAAELPAEVRVTVQITD